VTHLGGRLKVLRPRHWRRSRRWGCGLAQGFLLGHPMPAKAREAWIASAAS
jgi:EAL domain-containing protein (putative c-di-GMP-specific phosphodiesterase class I)